MSDIGDWLEFDDEGWTFAELRTFLDPMPERGRINKLLRKEFFIRNERGYWVPKEHAARYCLHQPSRPKFRLRVLPLLIVRLHEEYGEVYRPISSLAWVTTAEGLLLTGSV